MFYLINRPLPTPTPTPWLVPTNAAPHPAWQPPRLTGRCAARLRPPVMKSKRLSPRALTGRSVIPLFRRTADTRAGACQCYHTHDCVCLVRILYNKCFFYNLYLFSLFVYVLRLVHRGLKNRKCKSFWKTLKASVNLIILVVLLKSLIYQRNE